MKEGILQIRKEQSPSKKECTTEGKLSVATGMKNTLTEMNIFVDRSMSTLDTVEERNSTMEILERLVRMKQKG